MKISLLSGSDATLQHAAVASARYSFRGVSGTFTIETKLFLFFFLTPSLAPVISGIHGRCNQASVSLGSAEQQDFLQTFQRAGVVMGRNSLQRDGERERREGRGGERGGSGWKALVSAPFLAPLPGPARHSRCSSGCHCAAIDARGGGPSSLCHSESTRGARSSLVGQIVRWIL